MHVSMIFSLIDTKHHNHIEMEKKDSLVSTEYLIRPSTSEHNPKKKINAYSKRSRDNLMKEKGIRSKFLKLRGNEKEVRISYSNYLKARYM